MPLILPVLFGVKEAQAAADLWRANCGPGALAGVLGVTLDHVRPHLGGFERKGYTNPSLMIGTLNRMGIGFADQRPLLPHYGLVRVQWHGPWMADGVPRQARYRHTHWIGARKAWGLDAPEGHFVFDINAICAGGWIGFTEWRRNLVPWLLKQCEPKWDGDFSFTHCLELDQRDVEDIRELLLTGEGVPA